MKLFVSSPNKFNTVAPFPEEGREYLIDIDKRSCVDNDTKIKCYAKCIGRDEDMITFDCGVVCGDDLTIFVKATDMHQYDKFLIQDAYGSSIPYTPVLKEGPRVINPKYCIGKAYEIAFKNEKVSDAYGICKIDAIFIDKDIDDTTGRQTLYFVTGRGTFNFNLWYGSDLVTINHHNYDDPKEYTHQCPNDQIDVRELK